MKALSVSKTVEHVEGKATTTKYYADPEELRSFTWGELLGHYKLPAVILLQYRMEVLNEPYAVAIKNLPVPTLGDSSLNLPSFWTRVLNTLLGRAQ